MTGEGYGMRDGPGWPEVPDRASVSEPGIQSDEALRVWQEGIVRCKRVHSLPRSGPDSERFRRLSPLRQATASVFPNAGEGWGRGLRAEHAHLLTSARGSLVELQTQLIVAERVQLCGLEATTPVLERADQVRRILRGLICSLG